MDAQFSGMARLTHVPDPIARLGEVLRDPIQPTGSRGRSDGVLTRNMGVLTLAGWGVPLIGSALIGAVLLFSGHFGFDWQKASRTILDDREYVRAKILASEVTPRTMAQKMTLALARSPLPAAIGAIQAVRVSDVDAIPSIGPGDTVIEQNPETMGIEGELAAIVTGLFWPAAASVGTRIGADVWAIPMAEFDQAEVRVPRNVTAKMSLRVEVPEQNGTRARVGKLSVKPGGSVRVAKAVLRGKKRRWSKPSGLGAKRRKANKKGVRSAKGKASSASTVKRAEENTKTETRRDVYAPAQLSPAPSFGYR